MPISGTVKISYYIIELINQEDLRIRDSFTLSSVDLANRIISKSQSLFLTMYTMQSTEST